MLLSCLVDMLFALPVTNRLVVPPFKLSTIGSRAFPVSDPQLWIGLPEDITSAPSPLTFRKRLTIIRTSCSLVLFLSFSVVNLAVNCFT